MDARTVSDSSTPAPDEVNAGAEEKLSAYGRAKRRRERLRKLIRGAIWSYL